VLLTVCFASALYNINCLAFHIDFIFEISCSGTTASATNCEKGKIGAKQWDEKVTPLFEKLPSAASPFPHF
jgi:hypothetical protein